MPRKDDGIPRIRCLAKVYGKISRARGLLNSRLIGQGSPRCYVKGIKGNSHLVDFYVTEFGKGNDPEWNCEWSYDFLKYRAIDEFVGLKFVVYDGEDFLGGADVDISSMPEFREVEEELELAGLVFANKASAPKKARLFITVSVQRWNLPVLPRPKPALMADMRTIKRTTAICGRILRAKGLRPRAMAMCFVRAYMMSGKIIDVFTTKIEAYDVIDPNWGQNFQFDFTDPDDQPVVLMFNIFAADKVQPPSKSPKVIFDKGDHLGGAMMPVASIGDEEAFERGENRTKLFLQDECQLIEKRLERDGGKAMREAKALEDAVNPTKKTWMQSMNGAADGAMSFFTGPKKATGHDNGDENCFLSLDIFRETEELRMPHCELLTESIIVEESDLEYNPDPELLEYFGLVDEHGDTVKRLEVTSEERIFVLYGTINNAMDLIAADLTGKSDPYVVVEALTKSNETLFVYRTRWIKGCLNPKWMESFFWKVPPDPENPKVPVALSKIVFTLFDTDEFQTLEFGEDDFLGSCNADITLMRNADFINEDIPLLGVNARGSCKAAGFRRYSTISAEVRCERRVVRIVSPRHDFDADLLAVPRHRESRPMLPPDFPKYENISLDPPLDDPAQCDASAHHVLWLHENGKLYEAAEDSRMQNKQHEDAGWLHVPEFDPMDVRIPRTAPVTHHDDGLDDIDSDDDSKPVKVKYRRDYDTLQENWTATMKGGQAHIRNVDFVNRLPPRQHTGSLPMIATRFGERYRELTNVLNPFEEDWFLSSRRLHNASFAKHGRAISSAMGTMRSKPPIQNFSMRKEIDLKSSSRPATTAAGARGKPERMYPKRPQTTQVLQAALMASSSSSGL